MSGKRLYPLARPRLTVEKRSALSAIIATALLLVPLDLASAQPAESSVVYQFGRPVHAGEHTYDWYRRTHADAAAARYGVKASDVGDGMDTWHWWVGVDNPEFWREATKATSTAPGNLLGVKVDFLRVLNSVPRNKRFEMMGLINDPDTVAADKPDQYGLMLDRMKEGTLTWDGDMFGYSSGVIGLQLFVNKKFDPQKWSLAKYLENPASVEPPYNVGMACALCHVSFNPTRPPADVHEPKWENIVSNIGNQYFREGMLFGSETAHDSFIYQYLSTQEPGTSETSRFSSDFINGPVAMNSIYRVPVRAKLARPEAITPAQRDLLESMYRHTGLKPDFFGGALGGTAEQPTVRTPHVLADGADSMGLLMSMARVYVNEGSGWNTWVHTMALNPFDLRESIARNFATKEFDLIGEVRRDPNSPWMQTERRMPNAITFLGTYDSYPLKHAQEAARDGKTARSGQSYLTTDPAVLRRGKIAFADNCAQCHSSKQPTDLSSDPELLKGAWRQLVLRDDFLVDNYLSDDARQPLSELGTNAARATGTNAMAGHMWGQMSSLGYKQMKEEPVALRDHDKDFNPIDLYDPLTGKHDIKFVAPKAYYRTPPLVSIWATAPYLHNNSVGEYNGDPSIAGRMAAYEDGMSKLLWPERRRGVGSVKVTTEDSRFPDLFPLLKTLDPEFGAFEFDADLMRVPRGTPINLLTNVHPKDVKSVLLAYVDGVLAGRPKAEFSRLQAINHAKGQAAMLNRLLEVSTCPDFIEDKGHYYGHDLSDEDKRALIEYIKYF
jgi:mono/diheme cytochrome c family protein